MKQKIAPADRVEFTRRIEITIKKPPAHLKVRIKTRPETVRSVLGKKAFSIPRKRVGPTGIPYSMQDMLNILLKNIFEALKRHGRDACFSVKSGQSCLKAVIPLKLKPSKHSG